MVANVRKWLHLDRLSDLDRLFQRNRKTNTTINYREGQGLKNFYFSLAFYCCLCILPYGPYDMGRGDTTILVENFSTRIFFKGAPTCPRGWTVYRKNKNNFVECFKIGGNRQKCRKFSRLDRFLKIQESVDQFSNFYQFFSIF